jgi:hypothetical protein
MKKLSLFILIGLGFSLIAQKTKTASCGRYEYVQPPSNMVLQEFSTFYVEPSASAEKISTIKSNCKLTGFTQTTNEVEADFIVKHTVNRIVFKSSDYSKKSNTTTSKDGVKTTTVTHTYKGGYTYNMLLKIYSRENNELIYSTEFSYTKSISKSSTQNATYAYNAYKKEVDKARSGYIAEGVKALNTKASEELSYLNKSYPIKGIEVKAKKFDYDDYNKGILILKNFINTADKETRNTEINNAIKFWETEIPNADLESKKARINKKVLAGAYYNIGLAQFMLYNYEKAKEAFVAAQKHDKSVTAMHRSLIKECDKQIPRRVNLK